MSDNILSKLVEINDSILDLRHELVIQHKEILNVVEVAKLLGLSKHTIYSLCSAKKLPYFQRSKVSYFRRTEILAWALDSKYRIKTDEELSREAQKKQVT